MCGDTTYAVLRRKFLNSLLPYLYTVSILYYLNSFISTHLSILSYLNYQEK